jgi:hypothetical protein
MFAVRWAVVPVVLAVLLVTLDREATGWWPPRYTLERQVQASPAMLSMLSFGLRPLVADYLWIDAVQYFGHTLGRHVHDLVDGRIVERGLTGADVRVASRVFHLLIKRLLAVDPLFVRPPMLGAMFLMDPHADPALGMDILQTGARKNPGSWQLRLWNGFYSYALLRDKETARRELMAATACPGCPSYVADVRLLLETAPDTVLARVFWSRAYGEARTEEERVYLQQRLDELDEGIGGFGLEHRHEHEHHDHDEAHVAPVR